MGVCSLLPGTGLMLCPCCLPMHLSSVSCCLSSRSETNPSRLPRRVFRSLERGLSNALLIHSISNYSSEMQQNITFVNLEASKAPAGKRSPSSRSFKEAQSRSLRLCLNLSSLIMFSRLWAAEMICDESGGNPAGA